MVRISCSVCVLLFCFTLLQPKLIQAQVFPGERSRLNYRLVGFYVSPADIAKNAVIEIAKGSWQTQDQMVGKVRISVPAKATKNVIEVPDFGMQYTWRITTKENGKTVFGTLHHFSTLPAPDRDTESYVITVHKKRKGLKDAYVFVDCKQAAYDLDGKLIWFAPDRLGDGRSGQVVRDLKMSPFGTITAIAGNRITESDYNGLVSWVGPNNGKASGDSIERYHHEFTRLRNGRYMVLGAQKVNLSADAATIKDSLLRMGIPVMNPKPIAGEEPLAPERLTSVQFGTIIEYDRAGNVLWSWYLYPWFRSSYLTKNPVITAPVDVHENAFYYDEANNYIYLSLKNASQILKIGYPSGQVVATYGKSYKNVHRDTTPGVFCDQHAVKLTKDGYILMFNNNICNRDSVPTVIMLSESPLPNGELNVVWEFKCPVTYPSERQPTNSISTSGGNVLELKDGNIFISMCTPFSDMFLIDRKKNILWQARARTWDGAKKKRVPANSYRAYMVYREDMERLIWRNTPFGELEQL